MDGTHGGCCCCWLHCCDGRRGDPQDKPDGRFAPEMSACLLGVCARTYLCRERARDAQFPELVFRSPFLPWTAVAL